MMSKRDLALQATIPTVMVPMYTPFEQLSQPGDRILMASNGVFVEVLRKWGYFVRRVCPAPPIAVPYGTVDETTVLLCRPVPKRLMIEFAKQAAAECEVEIGAVIIWNETTSEFRLVRSHATFANGGNLDYVLPALSAGDHLVVDCHSHAHHPAFFSPQDDADDANTTKIAFVVGNCNLEANSFAMRFCVKGLFEPVPVDSGTFNQPSKAKESN